jgi:aromatic-L-amino-acid decarboxylase
MRDLPEPIEPEAFLERFAWHPEPELIGFRDEPTSRDALRALGEAAWAAALDYLYGEGFRRAAGEPADYAELRRLHFGDRVGPSPAPADPTPFGDLLAEFRDRLAPHMLNAWHPRTLSYFTPPPLMASIAGDVLAQVAHQGVDVWDAGPIAAFVEEEVGRWLCDLVGFGPESFALPTSGGVMANFIGLALARDVRLRALLRLDRPPRGAALEGCRVYASDQAHFSVARALDELGFPAETLRVIPADERYRLRAAPVAEAVAADRATGRTPFSIAAVAGSTNTGSIDDLAGLADLAAAEGLWLHVDAAYGGAVRLSERDAGLVPALERADSVTIDPHKWFFQAYDLGAIVVREGRHLGEVFGARRPEYYRGGEGTGSSPDLAAAPEARAAPEGPLNYYQLGFEGTRRWRSLKLWLSWKHLGTRGLGRLVELNLDVARHLARRVAEADDFEAEPPEPELSVVCFRHLPGGRKRALGLDAVGLDAVGLDDHQDRLQRSLEASGDGWISTTRLRGATWLRAGVVNYLTTEADIDRLLDRLRELA